MRASLFHVISAVALFAACGSMACAQTFQGSFTGTITDSTGAVIPSATVSATEPDKGFTRTTVSLPDGTYEIPLLPPGRYQLVASKPGFEKLAEGLVTLTVNQHQKIDFRMKVGEDATTITVEARPLAVDTQTSSIGTTIGQQKIAQVPLNGRDFLELTLFAPGVVPGTSGSRVSDRGGSINVNGMRDSMNSYWLDGLDDTSTGVGQFTVAPPIDSVQEFRMETGVYEAKFGAHAGAQVNIVTKSGTDEFHGSLYEFFRNSALDARNFFDPIVPPLRRNQFGGTVGGPVVVPGLYDGHDRSFFFFAYEGLRERRSFFDRARVPTAAERGGDFSDLVGPGCSVQTVLLNPLALFNGQVQLFTNINQVLPAADPTGQALVNLYPAPNISGAPCGGANFTAPVNRKINLDTYTARVDHRWGDHDSVFFRYNLNRDHEFQPSGSPPETVTSIPGFGNFARNAFQMAGMDWTHTFSASLANEFKLGYNRWQLRLNNQDQGNMTAQQLGIMGLNRADPHQTGLPTLNFAGYAGLGSDTTVPEVGAVNTFQVADTLTHVHGDHTLAYGLDVRAVRRGNFSVDSLIRGEFDFTGLVTGGLGMLPPQALQQLTAQVQQELQNPNASVSFGNGVADALLGLPTDWINGFQEYISGAFGEYDFFAQDDWKARRNLTLNLGLRYEYKGLTTDKYNHFANFDFNNGDLLVAGASAATLEQLSPTTGLFTPVGTLNLGSTAENRALQHPDRNNWGPRLGFAWQPFHDSRTVVRGGYGMFYDQTFGDVYFQKSNNPPFVQINTGNLGAALPLIQTGAFQIGSGAVIQNALSGVVGPFFPSLSPFQLNFDDAFIQEWSFDIQRELRGSWLFDVGYVGTRGLHLVQETDPNQPANLSVSNTPATLAACETTGCPRAYPTLSGFSYTQSSGSSIYHSLQVKMERHYSRGLAVLGAYTYSKSLDTNSDPFGTNRNENFPQNSFNLAAEKARSDFDFRHRLSLAYLYSLPVGASRWKLENPRLNYLVEGWELSGVATAQSGPPFTPQISGNISGADEQAITGQGHPTDRPNLTVSALYPAHQTPTQYVLASAFTAPAAFTFGNAGRNILTGPGIASWDFSLIRNFRLAESKSLQFRAEMFNIFNHANFDVPQRDVGSASFGQIFNTLQPIAGLASGGPGDPREVQLGLRLSW
ncbi:MAG TPA: TonB-dependent receptor [Terriglobia bacterium]|nr:TonB-dependent receptor [Terriglobia bacterium]